METGNIIMIVSFSIPIIVIILMFYFLIRGNKRAVKFSEELQNKISISKPAVALILSASQGITGGDINRIIHLKLQISDGFSSPYVVDVTWFINTLHFDKIKEGNAIMVKMMH